ncbi:M23 family metallopeptidase [Glaciecola sp. XM2]|uniref:M23 family metallopeptidase n=1 Tax=Glaciecola sp. XM2 TaxID=1914931 RepID=UPI001BDF68A7|nr:M23 family metallopeptidase [Glaciecola sp. XM2]MBT1450519.1 M23 family metallopeptidase [Glaciecola sp. XM2]
MNVTILVKGKNTRFAKRLSLKRVVSGFVLLSLVMLVSSRSTESVYENQIRLNMVKTGLQEQVALVEQLHENTDTQVLSIVQQLGSMQAQLTQLDSLTASLAQKSGLTPENFALPEELQAPLRSEHTLNENVEKMAQALEYKIQQLDALESILIGLNIEQESKLAGRPVEKGWLSSYYGIRKDPFNGRPTMHKGVDFAGKAGTGVIATGAGIVTWSGNRSGYGYLVEIDHGNGLRTRYGHNASLNVEVGDVVTKGQIIALMGNTGRSTGAHVHYEVLKNGKQIDPLPFVYR